MNNLAPIVLFVYNRIEETKQTIEALKNNFLAKDSELFIFSDAAANQENIEKVKKVRDYIKTVQGFKKVVIYEKEQNFGLAKSIIIGVTQIVNEYQKVIVLEDDLVTSQYFLTFMNNALQMYKDDKQVASISGYIYNISNLPDTFFVRGADCWGWATWKDRWAVFEPSGKILLEQIKKQKLEKLFDFNVRSKPYTKMLQDQIDGKNNSWAVRWLASTFLQNMLTLYPSKSYVQNIGFSNGTHCNDSSTDFKVELTNKYKLTKIDIIENQYARKQIGVFLKSIKKPIYIRLINKIKKIMSKRRNNEK
ncbi:glycosyl transferase [Campylobacter hyointestinalis subsp. hyointestinalis]|nr:glycosyl transferase [Campylobacter hyointestinalis subsp. hyointestinalis]PPB66385.1 glycosyl transferase [Campylobacter hyointestinalis subsp. hyointestinalis]PPB70998.1 glycosyl transferase [Campylobacter hyointestinalis subsp. hyointestinalis]